MEAMKWLLMVTGIALFTASIAPASDFGSPSDSASDTQAEAKEAKAFAEKEAARFMLSLESAPNKKLVQEAAPVLRWTNHLGRRFYGDVFVWTDRGRPEVVASITNVFGARHSMEREIHSLSLGRPHLTCSEKTIWEPSKPGIELMPIPEATPPADSPAGRLRELKGFANEFSASSQSGDDRWELRLLPQPVYRYASTNPEVLDGALFAFVKGADPDVFLMIEARRAGEAFQWQFAVARFTASAELKVSYRQTEVWRAAKLTSQEVQDARQPYFSKRGEPQ
jgi:hypothetical protein